MEGAEEFVGYADFGLEAGESMEIKKSSGSVFVRDLDEGQRPDFLKNLTTKVRRATMAQMLNKDTEDESLVSYKNQLLQGVD